MLFNTTEYILFLILILLSIYLTNRRESFFLRNILLLGASYYFYVCIQIWFVLLLIYITVVNYLCGTWIAQKKDEGKSGKRAVTVAICLSIGALVFFKYAYILETSILLPIGLSFFTFQALSYTIDIYRGKIQAENDFLLVALFIAFFPTLLSGPIERARNLLPQLREKLPMNWENLIVGSQLFIWGMFKKVVIADRLGDYINSVYGTPEAYSGSTLAIVAVCYSFQIYCDFSGYADMAIGSGRMMGIGLMRNFNFPYCANTIREFWRRWHIALTSWFTEYVYISMGGNRVCRLRWLMNISMVFLLSGIWHGATFSFILWGAMHAVFYLMEYYWGPKRPNWIYHVLVFILVTFAWIFFRIEDSRTAWNIIVKICTDMAAPVYWGSSAFSTVLTLALLMMFILREYLICKNIWSQKYAFEYVLLLIGIGLLGVSSNQFVYFQF